MRETTQRTKHARGAAGARGGGATRPTRSTEEVARLGREIYERDIRRHVEAQHHGDIVAIDVDSGNWAIASDLLEAVDLLQAQHPGAVNLLCEKVGHRALTRFGFGPLRSRA